MVLIPRHLIAQKCLPGGWRQAKKPEIPKPAATVPFSKSPSKSSIVDMVSLMLPGFELWEYRFWAADTGDGDKCVISECRGCQSVFGSKEARHPHLGNMGCSKRLTAAYKLLLKDKMCVICNMRSYQEKWGVPLCSKACIEAWCRVESQPDALKQALALVGDGND